MIEGRLDVQGRRLACLEAGEGPLLLFAHGTFGAKEAFLPQIERLGKQYRCVSIDLPGHGRSDYDPSGWGIDELLALIPALIAALGEERAILAGLSQGGHVFMRVALARPDLVTALVNMCAGAGSPPPAMLDKLRDFSALMRDERDEAARRDAANEFAEAFHAPGFASLQPNAFAEEVSSMLAHDRAAMPLIAQVPASYVSILDRLPEIACPTLVIWGDRDFRPTLGEDIAARIPEAELQVIPDAGHHVNVDAPHATADAIGRFLGSVAGLHRQNASIGR